MIVLGILLGILAVAGIAGTVVLIAKDGYRPVRTRPHTVPATRPARARRHRLPEASAVAEPRELVPATSPLV
jgi:hypothetical protein